MINKEKLLLTLGFTSGHEGKSLKHKDVTVLSMKVGVHFNKEDVKDEIVLMSERFGGAPEYGVSDGAHNLVKDAGML